MPNPARIAVIFVNSLNISSARIGGTSESDVHQLRRNFVTRLRVIRQQDSNAAVLTDNECIYRLMSSFYGKQLSAEVMQELKSSIDRLRDTIEIEQPESAMKRDRGKIVLFEDVGESPITVALNEAVSFQRNLRRERRCERLIVKVVARI